jgi:hypothetical protein
MDQEEFPLTQVMGTFPNPTPPPMTPYQPVQQREPLTPIKAEQQGITPIFRTFDSNLIGAINNVFYAIDQARSAAKSSDDQRYFNQRIENFRTAVNQIIAVHAGKRRKTKKKRSRRS